MQRSNRLGIASVAILAGLFVGGPIPFVAVWLSVVLGALAVKNGSRWWLIVPAVDLLVFGFLLFLGLTAR